MSVAYIYANTDKAQYFHCGIFGWSSEFSAIGQGPGARALANLLSERGTWKGDRIAIASDTSTTDEFYEIICNAVDIEVEVKLMLFDVDGLEWIEELIEQSNTVFEDICAIALLLPRPDLAAMLDKKFGVGKWHRRYARLLQEGTDLHSQRIIDARDRNLKILAS